MSFCVFWCLLAGGLIILFGYTSMRKSIGRLHFVFSPGGSGWSQITYFMILKAKSTEIDSMTNSEPYLIITTHCFLNAIYMQLQFLCYLCYQINER